MNVGFIIPIKDKKNLEKIFFEEPPKPFLQFLKKSLNKLMIIIFLSANVIQIGLTITNDKKTGWLDGESVLFAVFVVVSVDLLQIGKKSSFMN